EPTNGLDPNQILEIRNLIRKIAEDRTVILSTHMLSEVQAACNDIIMLAEGRIVFSGTIGEFDGYLLPTSIVLSVIEEHAAEEIALMPQVLAVESMGGIRYRVKVQDVDEMLEVLIQESVQKK